MDVTKRKSDADSLRYRRIVAKFGTNLLTAGTDRLDLEVMSALVGQVARLHQAGAEVILVTSGAIAAGRHQIDCPPDRRDGLSRQVLAAVGQSHLMQCYDELFSWHGITIAQALLSRRDLSDRVGYLNARNTLLALLELRAVPIVNENDVVAVEEIEGARIGDNDNLSALVANLVDADLLVMLTDTGGLYTADPRLDRQARLIARVDRIDEEIERLAGGASPDSRGTGGMATKIEAAKLAVAGGATVVIVGGGERDVLPRLARGEELGTLFPSQVDRMESRKRWMLSRLAVRGRITVDAGAARALQQQNKSLLPAGVKAVDGAFERGEAVDICTVEGKRIACGIVNYSRDEVEAIRGLRSDRIAETLGHDYGSEVVHRSNLVLL
ncbi:MAG: glutamate 5-kinase [Dehalococcoidia bacterium]|nr:glutamate 5-kinase [Dehalococcoidia bacterium]